ncbi:RHS repeat-associated core domain-containing protein [Pseudomonas putida]|nr:RHS repeat-associated core domain-containing protein [Pseudomonas putida]
MHYNRYRYYDPQVGRFSGKDPIGFSGGLNIYT